MFCKYRFFFQTGSTKLKPSKVRGFFLYFLRFQASLFSTYFTLFYKTLIKYLYSYQVYLKNKKIILYQYVFNFGHPEKRPKSPKLPEVSKWTLLTWMYMLFDIIIYLNNFMLQNNEMSKGRKNIFYLMYPTSATLKRGQKHIKCCNLMSFEPIFSKFSGMFAYGQCIT